MSSTLPNVGPQARVDRPVSKNQFPLSYLAGCHYIPNVVQGGQARIAQTWDLGNLCAVKRGEACLLTPVLRV